VWGVSVPLGHWRSGGLSSIDGCHSFARQWKSWDSNWCPWSVAIVFVHPKWAIQAESWEWNTVSLVMSGRGKASSQWVQRSTALREYWNPAEDGRGPTRSMCMWRKQAVGRGKSPKGMTVWQETLECWQVWRCVMGEPGTLGWGLVS